MHMFTYANTYMYTHECMQLCVTLDIDFVYTRILLSYVYTCIYIYTHMHINIHTHTSVVCLQRPSDFYNRTHFPRCV